MRKNITAGLPKEEVDEMRGAFIGSSLIRKRIQYLLESKVQEHFKAQYNRTNYEDPNWLAKQADSMGYIRGLREVQSLLDDNKKPVIQDTKLGRPTNNSKNPEPLI